MTDTTRYADLTVVDVDAAALVDRAISYAAAMLPGWVPREGNTEVVAIESWALVVMELVYAINRVPGALTMELLRLYGVTRDPGRPPTATVTVTAVDAAGYDVPAGTILRVDTAGTPLLFATDADAVIPDGSTTSAPIPVTGLANTDVGNGIAAGTPVGLISGLYFAETVELATPVADGALPEDDVALLDRGIKRLRRINSAVVTAEHFREAAEEEVDVARALVVDLYDGTGTPTMADTGHVWVAVLGPGGTLLSSGRMAAIQARLQGLAVAGLTVHVDAPTITAQAVTVTVHRLAGYSDAEVEAAVTTAIAGYLDRAAWPWAATIRRTELVALIDGVEGVDYVDDLTVPAADVALTGAAPLADAGAITVTVEAP